jgi:trans-resveratrol di-O-methyltransferase
LDRIRSIMGLSNEVSASELLQAQAQIWYYACNYVNSMSLKSAIQLGIPDTIHNHGQPMTLSKLVGALHLHPSKSHGIYCLMRLLVHSGFFAQQKVAEIDEQEGYILTPASRLLLKDEPFRAAPLAVLLLEPSFITPWNCMTTWFQSNDPTPFEMANGRTFWDHLAHEPTFKNAFYEAMHTDSKLIASVLIEEFKWAFEGLKSLVDVGGGSGTMAISIADAFPDIKCTVLDLPHVVANLERTKNLDFVEGDMFEAIPPGNAILLKVHIYNTELASNFLFIFNF